MMRSPFDIDGPAVISFSGGRTSAYMLRRIADAGLRPDVHVLFCNTGKEDAATLDFVHAVGERWGIPIVWLEYHRARVPRYKSDKVAAIAQRFRVASSIVAGEPGPERGFREVTYRTASRQGEPYENFVAMSGLPNPAHRTCTTDLKVRVMKRWMLERGYASWDMVMGIRADEPRRVAKLNRSPPERWEHLMPLAEAGVREVDVLDFWRLQPFDLQLEADPVAGTYLGNCDGCILKGTDKLLRIEREHPGRLSWWADVERDAGSVFRIDRPAVHQLRVLAGTVERTGAGDDLGDCFCHD